MIESEEKHKKITLLLETWAKNVKIKPYLRDYDIPFLVDNILDNFYSVTFCCGHKGHFDDGVHIEFYTHEGRTDETTSGLYCRDCAERYKKELKAWEVNNE
jgi:hypothetical protein